MAEQRDRPPQERGKKRPSFTTLILAGLVLGLIWGLFLGEYGAWVKWIGDAYVGLLQMTVLPYVALSLTCNIGRLSAGEGSRLAWISFCVLLLLWVIGLATLVMQLSFPMWDGGSFFTTSMIQDQPQPDWLKMFIPSNPFWSLANNLVPAVVLFSLGLGAALIPVANKELLLEKLDILIEGLSRLNKLVVRTSPVGIFAIVGHTAGTISMEQFALLQGYLLVYGAAALLLSLWVIPSLIACCTPFSQREVLTASRDVLITAFIIGNTFVVLPMIIDAVKRLMEKHQLDAGNSMHAPEYTVQLAYPFPDLGRIVGLIFIPFAAWFYGTRIEWTMIPPLIGTGFVGAFAKLVVTIPLLLDLAEIPADIFNLFLAAGVIAGRFGDLMKASHLLAFSALTACYLMGAIRINYGRLLTRGLTTAALFAVTIVGIRSYLFYSFQDDYSRESLLVARPLLGQPVKAEFLQDSGPNPVPVAEGEDPMDRILRRGVIRIGFDKEQIPFSYLNEDGQLVGFDIDMAHELARDLGVTIEFVPISADITTALRADRCDVAMSGLEGTIRRATELPDMEAYMVVTRALVVPDRRRRQFSSVSRMIKELPKEAPLRVALVAGSMQAERQSSMDSGLGTGAAVFQVSGIMDYVEIVEVASASEFFESQPPVADILATNAEVGSAWTLKYPKFTVVKPKGFDAQTPLHYFVAHESRFEKFMNAWVRLKRLNGTHDQLYDYWILGRDKQGHAPRWCILRDVLHWVD